MAYDCKKKPSKSAKVKEFIRESIDSFHSTLVTESKICISLVVFGPLGAGKSFFLNFLLNWGLRGEYRVENGPLPSGFGDSKTLRPLYLKYGKKVQVLYKQKGASPEVWFPERELGNEVLKDVNNLLKRKFQDLKTGSIELQGPFPVFNYLKRETKTMTSSGHLELEVDVQFVDVPGCGDEIGNEDIDGELRKADIVLFFNWGQSGRPVSSEDIAQIFRRYKEFKYTSRPKLVHVFNDKGESSGVSSCNFDVLCKAKKEELNKAWLSFLSSSLEDEATAGCYRDVRAKLPPLNVDDLLEKFSSESEVIYFHSENAGLLGSLRKVITDHVQSVKMKQLIHPVLQKVHCAAKKLKTRVGQSINSSKNPNSKPAKVEEEKVIFEMFLNGDEEIDLVTSFLAQTTLQLQPDFKSLHRVLCENFLYSSETLAFLLKMLKESLKNFTEDLIDACRNAKGLRLQDVPTDLLQLIETVCESRVDQFCANSAHAYLRHVLDEVKKKNLFVLAQKKRWSDATHEEQKKDLCDEFLHILLSRTKGYIGKKTRNKKCKKSCFWLIQELKQVVKDLFAVGSLGDDASRPDVLRLLHRQLQTVIEFCKESIREFNPHPSLDVQAYISLPEKMIDKDKESKIPSQSSYEKIIEEITELLRKPKGADAAIRKLSTKLKHGDLKTRQTWNVDQLKWAKALVNVLSDKDHFDMKLEPSLVLDDSDADVKKLLDQARKRLFAHQKSSVTCKIVSVQSLPENEIHLRKKKEENRIEVLVSSKVSEKLDTIRKEFKDRSQNIAPIFMPTIRPGPMPYKRGNYFLEEDPWSKDALLDNRPEDESDRVDLEVKEENAQSSVLDLNIFLVVEKQHLRTFQSTINELRSPTAHNVNLMYIVLPQEGRGIGVTRAIIKSLAECFNFSLYWTIDDDIKFMFQFDGNERKWKKCSLTRGLLFGQRVFQTCRESCVKELSHLEKFTLLKEGTSSWPTFAKATKDSACTLIMDQERFTEVQKNPDLLKNRLFTEIAVDCGEDSQKEKELIDCVQRFVKKCNECLFKDTINHIAGVSIAHESSQKYDYMSKYPSADYMCSEQRYQVVLHNTSALKGMNYVTDEMIFLDEENQVFDKDKRNTPYWGIRGSDKSFCHALTISGVIGYQVIRVVHSHKKLINVFDRVGPSYHASQSPHRSEDEDEGDD